MLAELEASAQEGTVREPSPEAIAQAREMDPIDDIFFNKMGESPEVCEEIISTVLQMPVNVRGSFFTCHFYCRSIRQ